MTAPVSRDAWVQAALDAAVQQHGSVAIDDPATLDAIAEVLAHADPSERETPVQH